MVTHIKEKTDVNEVLARENMCWAGLGSTLILCDVTESRPVFTEMERAL